MKVLVTGAAGFAGRHLCRRLLECGHEVVGTALYEQELGTADHPLVTCDITDAGRVGDVVAWAEPDAVVHLAGVTSVPLSEEARTQAIRTNVHGTSHVLRSTAAVAPGAAFLAISSAEVYGKVAPDEQPLRETRPVAPASVYADTKASVETLAASYAEGLRVVILRPFNHIGPGQSPAFVASSFARQIAQIEAGRVEPVLRVGNLEAKRDFTDVRDVAEAYRLALDRCEPNTPYNICSGRAVSIRELLDHLLGMSDATIRVEQDPARLRPSDVPTRVGSPDKFVAATGWTRRYGLERTLADVLDHWRSNCPPAPPELTSAPT